MEKAVSAFRSTRVQDIGSVGRCDRVFRSARMRRGHIFSTCSRKHGSAAPIRPDRSDKTLKFEIRNVRDLLTKVVAHFQAYPLLSSKQADVERFSSICRWMSEGRHFERVGFEQIVQTAMEMNPSGKRKYSGSEILGSLRSGERIVYATSNRGRT